MGCVLVLMLSSAFPCPAFTAGLLLLVGYIFQALLHLASVLVCHREALARDTERDRSRKKLCPDVSISQQDGPHRSSFPGLPQCRASGTALPLLPASMARGFGFVLLPVSGLLIALFGFSALPSSVSPIPWIKFSVLNYSNGLFPG